MTEIRMTGGCQCGTVRFALHGKPFDPCICHCRMCQKQFGNYFGAFASIDEKYFEITRGKIALFRSSDLGERGFCRDCGTPLLYKFTSETHVAVTLGSLDDPSAMKPLVQYGVESRMPWFAELAALPAVETDKIADGSQGDYGSIEKSNRQHPDHDTEVWPLQK